MKNKSSEQLSREAAANSAWSACLSAQRNLANAKAAYQEARAAVEAGEAAEAAEAAAAKLDNLQN